jgi:two-component system, chemotaxis family, chemotaxis protein CheY
MKSCLIVDDSKIVRKVMRKIIEPLGFSISEAENGQEALDIAKKETFSLIMLDWNMPVMTGIEFLKLLRALPDIEQPQVIFCTTENEFSKIQEALISGANEYVMKPFDEDIIRGKLEQLGLL